MAAITFSSIAIGGGQCRDLDCCAGRIWFGRACENIRRKCGCRWKILFHVSEKDRDVDDVLPGRASVFQHEPHILEYCMALRFDIVTNDAAGSIECHSGNFFAAAHTRSDPRQKQQLAHAFRVRKRPNRFRRSFAFEVSLMAYLLPST